MTPEHEDKLHLEWVLASQMFPWPTSPYFPAIASWTLVGWFPLACFWRFCVLSSLLYLSLAVDWVCAWPELPMSVILLHIVYIVNLLDTHPGPLHSNTDMRMAWYQIVTCVMPPSSLVLSQQTVIFHIQCAVDIIEYNVNYVPCGYAVNDTNKYMLTSTILSV